MPNVTVYSTTVCPWCHKAKDFLKAHKIPFRDVNVQEDQKAAQEMVKKSGQMGVPVIDIDGQIIVGFNRQALERALKIKG